MRKTTAALALFLAVVMGGAVWLAADRKQAQAIALSQARPPIAQNAPAPAAVRPATAAMGAPPADPPPATVRPPQTRVEDVDVADTETTLERIIPRRSAGHARGLCSQASRGGRARRTGAAKQAYRVINDRTAPDQP